MPRKIKNISTEFELRLDELPRLQSGVVRWEEVFGSRARLRIEIGVGNSPFLIEVAKRASHFQYLGFEYCKRRLLKFLGKVHKTEITNIRMLRIDITQVFEHIFAAGSIDHFYINHPDPWPKHRHVKKRLARHENVRILIRLLGPGGGLSLRTDSGEYAQQMLATLDEAEGIENLAGRGSFTRTPLEPHSTPFERKFKDAGSTIFYLEYRETSESPGRPITSLSSSMTRDKKHSTPPPELIEKVARFPNSPGVYIMKDAASRIIYIGKAVNLRSRVRSYLGRSTDNRVFYSFLVGRIFDVDCIVTESEAEALILENNLIKKHRPVYNVRLKDDKSYVSIKVTTAETWPRVLVTRRYKKDGNLYFGPYGSAGAVREMLRMIEKVFPLRTCTNSFFANRTRPCIEYEIGRCTAPCVDIITREDYQKDLEEVILFLKGKNRELLSLLESKMLSASKAREYELATRYRDQIRAIERVFESQKAQEWGRGDRDVFATVREKDLVAVQEILVREGRIVNSHCHTFRTSLSTEEVIASFMAQYYLSERYIPPEILSNLEFADRPLIESWLRERKRARVEVKVPRRGDRLRLIEMAEKNCYNSVAVSRTYEERFRCLLASLQKKLGMKREPRRIECYDISNFQGSLAVGSMVRFEDGRPVKDRYRKFRIQTVVGANDFDCMREVLERRFRSGGSDLDLPDLVMVDGGKGQLGVATTLFSRLALTEEVAVIGLAKERRREGRAERVYLPGQGEPLPLPQDSPESLYLQRIRDEAHRFALRYHRELRKKATLRTGLEEIPGIGKKRRRALLEKFGTLRNIRTATQEEIAAVVGKELGRRVYEKLGREGSRGKGVKG